MEEITLTDYLTKRKKKLSKLEKEISFLENIKIPLTLRMYYKDYMLISEDYSLATDFKIRKRTETIGGFSYPDGGTDVRRYDFYPQFYFKVKKCDEDVKIYIKHKGFDEDKDVIIRSVEKTTGWGIYNDDIRNIEKNADVKKTISFFEDKGVQKELLKKLEGKINNFYEWVKL